MKRSVDAKGKTREEAIAAGLEALDLTIDEVTVEDIEEGSKGLFGFFGSRLWTVRVTAREDEEEKDSVLDTHSLFASSLDEPEPKKNTESKPAPEKKKAPEKKSEKRSIK